MVYQQYGFITNLESETNVLLCVDQDRPHEFLFTILPTKDTPYAILAIAEKLDESPICLKLSQILRPAANGGIVNERLSESETDIFAKSEIFLKKADDGSYSGIYRTPTKSGDIILQVPATKSKVALATVSDWSEFKSWASLAPKSLDVSLFRGHGSNKFKLRASNKMGMVHAVRFVAYASK